MLSPFDGCCGKSSYPGQTWCPYHDGRNNLFPVKVLHKGEGLYCIKADVRIDGENMHIECMHRNPEGWSLNILKDTGWIRAQLKHYGETRVDAESQTVIS